MSRNPFDDLNSLAPSQNYSQQNPFDDDKQDMMNFYLK